MPDSLHDYFIHITILVWTFFSCLGSLQIPNPLFDLAGITCGHFLVPFWTFFGATLIGKAFVKMHIQVDALPISNANVMRQCNVKWKENAFAFMSSSPTPLTPHNSVKPKSHLKHFRGRGGGEFILMSLTLEEPRNDGRHQEQQQHVDHKRETRNVQKYTLWVDLLAVPHSAGDSGMCGASGTIYRTYRWKASLSPSASASLSRSCRRFFNESHGSKKEKKKKRKSTPSDLFNYQVDCWVYHSSDSHQPRPRGGGGRGGSV